MVDNFDIRVGCGPTGAADRLAGSKMAVGGAQWGAGAASYWPEGGAWPGLVPTGPGRPIGAGVPTSRNWT